MKNQLILCILSLAIWAFGTTTETVIAYNANKTLLQAKTNLAKNEISVQFALPSFKMEQVLENGENFTKITSENFEESQKEGYPELPVISKLVAVPFTGDYSVTLINPQYRIVKNVKVYPAQKLKYESEEHKSAPFVKSDLFYNSAEVYPSQNLKSGAAAFLRDYRVADLQINPFQYNAATQELKIMTNAEIKISYSSGSAFTKNGKKISKFFEPLYKSVIANYESLPRSEYQQPSYLIIYPNQTGVADIIKYLTNWRHQQGFVVKAVSTAETGTTLETIKAYIQNAYSTWANPPEFVTIAGDVTGTYSIPTGSVDGGEGDQTFVLLAGNDILADAYIGRLSFGTTTHLQTIISKTLKYEQTPYMTNTDWLHRALLVGDVSHSGESCISTNKYIKSVISDNERDFTFTEEYSGNFVNAIANGINQGAGFFNYRGWYGMSGWTNTNISSLNNGPMTPIAVFLTCGTGVFAAEESRSEAFIRAGTAASPKGAVAAIGTATLHTHTCYNNIVAGGTYNGIFNEKIYHIGAALNRGKVSLFNSYPENQNNAVAKFSYWNNLMGDPALHVWTNVPQKLTVTHLAAINPETGNLEIIVKTSSGTVVSDAWVTLLKGADEVFVSGMTDKNGKVALPLNAMTAGSMSVTVTKHNFLPYMGTITVGTVSSLVKVSGVQIDDDASGSSIGNGNTEINPGETIELKAALKNSGTAAVNAITATISSADDFVTILNGNITYGNIAAGATLNANPFVIKFKPQALNGQVALLKVEIKDNGTNIWTDFIRLQVKGANLAVTGTIVTGSSTSLIPGTTSDLSIKIKNSGVLALDGVSAVLRCADGRVTIGDSTAVFGNIAAGATVENNADKFKLTPSIIIMPGTEIPFTLKLTSTSGYNSIVKLVLKVGNAILKDPLGPDAYGHFIYDSGDTGYESAPVYNWIEIDPALGGAGTNASLTSSGNGGAVKVVTLPFNMVFYGKSYNQLTICTNGWVAPGASDQTSYMNWPIPGPMGPSPMIAAFWDDLKTDSNGKIFYYYDSANKRYIVEWSNLTNDFDNAVETFQVIIYNPQFQINSMGESDIVIQYKTINNTDAGSYYSTDVSHGEYATVGIENYTGNDGIQYTYANKYLTAAKPLANGLALKITCPPMPHNEGYLVFNNLQISGGNGNQIAESGETINLKAVLSNIGQNNSTGISAVLSTTDTYISVIQNSSAYPNIAGQGEGSNSTDFKVSIGANCPDNHSVEMLLKVTTAGGVFNIPLTLITHKAALELKSTTISGADNILDPAETATLNFNILNTGGASAENITGTLSTTNTQITINQNSASLTDIAPGQARNLSFSISTAISIPVGTMVPFKLDLAANGISLTRTVVIPIGLILETFESGNFTLFAWNNSSEIPWTTSNSAPYAGTYSAKSGVVTHNQNSSLKIQIDVEAAKDSRVNPSIEFYKKVSSESGFDFFSFIVDGVEKEKWSGEVAWSASTYDLTPGIHNLEWRYSKDEVQNGGSDCAWLDNIKFPKMHTPVYSEIDFDQTVITGVALAGDSSVYDLKISNLGLETLNYIITKKYSTTTAARDSGGPDNFGYTWLDSDNGAIYNWLDKPTDAVKLTFANNTNSSALIPIGFDFKYYGQTYQQFRVSPDGWVGFGADNSVWQNTAIPSVNAPKPALLAFWDDLNPLNTQSTAGGGEIFYQKYSDKVVVWYETVQHWNTQPGTYTFQVIFYKTGKIVYQYKTMTGIITSATIGCQNGNGADGLQIINDNTYMKNNLRVEINPPADWLKLADTNGAITAGLSKKISLKLNAADLSVGTYKCNLTINSNDLDEASVTIPVNFLVVNQINGSLAVSVDTLKFGTCHTDLAVIDTILISNIGAGPIGITEISINGSKFSTNMTPFALNAGAQKKIGIKFLSHETGTYTGELIIKTNSLITPEKRVILKAKASDSLSIANNLPTNWQLSQNYPNPFNPQTKINYAVKDGFIGLVKIAVYNIRGEKVADLVNGQHQPGFYTAVFNAAGLSSGVYYYQIQTKDFNALKKMMILK